MHILNGKIRSDINALLVKNIVIDPHNRCSTCAKEKIHTTLYVLLA